ncbi:MAG: HAMP domain-containing histidine kinase [Sulfurospirillum sp.]|nr:HAMP domain-containing histidine kinase [Sulfurospirillum sp.]
MLSQKSIRNKFALQLVLASATLIVIFSVILYNYIKISIYEDLTKELIQETTLLVKQYKSTNNPFAIDSFGHANANFSIKVVIRVDKPDKITFEQNREKNKNYLTVFYPFEKNRSSFLAVTKDISNTDKLLESILKNVMIINLSAIFLIIFNASLLSRMLIIPIHSLTTKLASMDENFFQSINTKNIPIEFLPLANSINHLVERIHHFVKYQKELFIGTAHELKTPLAVMKTKNEVTLLRPRENEKYIETIKQNNQIIDEMSKMISNILEIGRQEGAQFEQPITIDLIKFLQERANNFAILANQEKKIFKTDLQPTSYMMLIQPTLLIHVLQNFVQNAIKFTPQNGEIILQSIEEDQGLRISVIDSGIGIDESKDLFAPFKRYGDKSGAGLGLFLAKSAADALGGRIWLVNRTDTIGTIATLFLPSNTKKIIKK